MSRERELLKRLRNALNISADDFNDLMDDLDAELAKPENPRHATKEELLFAGLLLNAGSPMTPHHYSAIKEYLGNMTKDEIIQMVCTGIKP